MTDLKDLYAEKSDWKPRHEILIPFIQEWLKDNGDGKTYENRHITKIVMKEFDLTELERRVLSRDISGLAKDTRMKPYVRFGPEMKLYGKMTRTRVFAAPGSPEGLMYEDCSILQTNIRTQGLDRDNMYAASRELKKLGWITISPAEQERGYGVAVQGDEVKSVDKPKTSRHPRPGLKQVVCGECGGDGKVYMES